MYLFNNALRDVTIKGGNVRLPKLAKPISQRERVIKELKGLGLSRSGLSSTEARYLLQIIHTDEHIGGVVFGHSKEGFAMLVATDRRVIFIDKKPFFVNEDEVNYYVVSGVSFKQAGFGSTVTLHTRVRDYSLQTFNKKCAISFVEFIEAHCLEHSDTDIKTEAKEYRNDQLT